MLAPVGIYPWRADGLGFTWHSSGEEAPVATGPEDYAAVPDGHGRLRASRADREQAIGTLKAAFVQGRLTKDELDERVGRAALLDEPAHARALDAHADIPRIGRAERSAWNMRSDFCLWHFVSTLIIGKEVCVK